MPAPKPTPTIPVLPPNGKMHSADNIDSQGKSWPTVGDNIRYGQNGSITSDALKAALEALFPIGSIWVGDFPPFGSSWEDISPSRPVYSLPNTECGEQATIQAPGGTATDTVVVCIKIWRRTA